MAQRAASVLPSSLAYAEDLSSSQVPSEEKYILIEQTMEVDTLVLFCKSQPCTLLLLRFPLTEKSIHIIRGTSFRKTWFMAIHTPLLESISIFTGETASSLK